MKKEKNKIVYLAMPKGLYGHQNKKIVDLVKEKFVLEIPLYKDRYFFNPCTEIDQNRDSNEIMEDCFKAVEKSVAVLYILPLPPMIDSTVTLGAISECDLGLEKNKPVFVCAFDKSVLEFFEVKHIDLLMDKFGLKAPIWWFETRDLNISKKFRDQEVKTRPDGSTTS